LEFRYGWRSVLVQQCHDERADSVSLPVCCFA